MGLSETKASCPLLSFALSIFPDFVIFLNSMERNRRHLYTRSEGFSKKRSAVSRICSNRSSPATITDFTSYPFRRRRLPELLMQAL